MNFQRKKDPVPLEKLQEVWDSIVDSDFDESSSDEDETQKLSAVIENISEDEEMEVILQFFICALVGLQ